MTRALLLGCILVSSAGCGLDGADESRTRKRVFITSAEYSSDLGGLTGGDARCTSLAQAGQLGASFTAWLSDDFTDARERIVGDGSWYLVDRSTLVFTSTPGIALGPVARIGMNESGAIVADTESVWTATRSNGTKDFSCNNWAAGGPVGEVGLIGRASASTTGWTATGLTSCSNVARLYCFEH